MQISKIQNVIKNNFQYKNNPIKFNPVNFKGQDTFERNATDDTIASKKYYRGNKEFSPEILMQITNRLFIKQKDRYIPYTFHLDEYNSKNELLRHIAYNNGFRYIVDSFKDGKLIQQDKYEDTYGFNPYPTKRTSVVKFNYSDDAETKQTFTISRNYGKDWKKHPEIKIQKTTTDGTTRVYFSTPSEEKLGHAHTRNTADPIGAQITIIEENGIYKLPPKNKKDIELLLNSLQDLKDTIQSEEFNDDFGNNEKFDSELDKAIEFLNAQLNED